jgi:murein DD-endopeptidase MepM/ murein hydrolase activator NlpD
MRSSASLRIVVSFLLALCLAAPATASAYSSSDVRRHQAAASAARAKAARKQAEAAALLEQTQTLEDRIAAIEKQVEALGGQIGTVSKRRAALDAEVAVMRADIAAKTAQIAQLTTDYEARLNALAARADTVYRDGDWAWLEVLLDSQDLGDFIQRTEYVNLLIADDEASASELEHTRAQLDAATAGLDRDLESIQVKRAEIKAQEDGLRNLQSSRDGKRAAQQAVQDQKSALLAETRRNIAHLRAMASAEEQESARIARLLRNGGSHGSGKHAGTLTWPCPGHTSISSPFGYRMHPILHTRKLHTGIDIRAPSSARIVAAASGKVIYAGSNGGYGNFTMIDHGNGLVTCYAHQKRIVVSSGQHVSAGTTIGYVGSTGMSTGPHLHFEVRVNGTPVDPMRYL